MLITLAVPLKKHIINSKHVVSSYILIIIHSRHSVTQQLWPDLAFVNSTIDGKTFSSKRQLIYIEEQQCSKNNALLHKSMALIKIVFNCFLLEETKLIPNDTFIGSLKKAINLKRY